MLSHLGSQDTKTILEVWKLTRCRQSLLLFRKNELSKVELGCRSGQSNFEPCICVIFRPEAIQKKCSAALRNAAQTEVLRLGPVDHDGIEKNSAKLSHDGI
jgi:hypothetical protein